MYCRSAATQTHTADGPPSLFQRLSSPLLMSGQHGVLSEQEHSSSSNSTLIWLNYLQTVSTDFITDETFW